MSVRHSLYHPDEALARPMGPAQVDLLRRVVATNGGGISAYSEKHSVVEGLIKRHMIQGKRTNEFMMVHTRKGLEWVRAHSLSTSGFIFRVQDGEGRGPFRPGGFIRRWAEPHWLKLPTWMEEFGPSVVELRKPWEHIGCGVRAIEQIRNWFSPGERERLLRLGYNVVSFPIDRVLAESANQVVFARAIPLRDFVTTHHWPAP